MKVLTVGTTIPILFFMSPKEDYVLITSLFVYVDFVVDICNLSIPVRLEHVMELFGDGRFFFYGTYEGSDVYGTDQCKQSYVLL